MPDQMKLYYDHYKDSFEQIKTHTALRERYFSRAVILFSASIFATFNPSYVQEISGAASKAQFGIDLNLAFYTISSLLTFLSLWYLTRYYQSVLLIENLYTYIHQVESQLSAMLSPALITREGTSYLSSYPLLKSFIHFFYFTFFPLIVIIFSAIKGYWEIYHLSSTMPCVIAVFNIVCMAFIFVLTLLYLSWVHFKDFKKTYS